MRLVTLRKRAEFLQMQKEGVKWITPSFILQHGTDTQGPRVGFTATKKLGGAVMRNRAKRLMRQVVRLNLDQLQPHKSYVLIARAAIFTTPFIQLQKDFLWALKRLKGRDEES